MFLKFKMDDFNAQWRASAHEAVPYGDDLPECLNILPELIDGAIAQGNASCVTIHIDLKKSKLRVYDNGKGITNPKRLLSWASSNSVDVHHRYGHGSKKCLTKWSKDYNTAKWFVRYRTCDKRGKSGSLFTYNSPFIGINSLPDEDENDDVTLMPSGTEWSIDFDINILGNFKDLKLFNTVKEIIRTRYSSYYLDKTEFIVQIDDICESSKGENSKSKWTSFEECLKDEVKKENAVKMYDKILPFNENVTMRYTQYYIHISGQKPFDLKSEFPIYGHKNLKCARLHIALMGRTIEIPYIWKFYEGKDSPHNDFNGTFGMVDFQSHNGCYDNMPSPSTTKVSYYVNCPNYKKFHDMILKIHQEIGIPSKIYKHPIAIPITVAALPITVAALPIMPVAMPVAVPANVRNTRRKIPHGVRTDIWNKYIGEEIGKHKCLCCKRTTISQSEFHCGHVISVHDAGPDTVDNLRPICSKCNRSMGTKNMIDYVTEHEYYFG